MRSAAVAWSSVAWLVTFFAREIGLTLVVSLRLLRRRRSARLAGLGLLKRQLVGLLLDDEQRRAGFDGVAVVILDLLDEALDARDQRRAVDRRSIAGRHQIARHGLLQRQRHLDLRRWRRNECVPFAAR